MWSCRAPADGVLLVTAGVVCFAAGPVDERHFAAANGADVAHSAGERDGGLDGCECVTAADDCCHAVARWRNSSRAALCPKSGQM